MIETGKMQVLQVIRKTYKGLYLNSKDTKGSVDILLAKSQMPPETKIGDEIEVILYFGLLISILLQQFMFNAPFSQYAAEFILLMVSAAYVVARNIIVGSGLYNTSFSGQKLVVINSVVCGFTIAAVTTSLNVINLGFHSEFTILQVRHWFPFVYPVM
jgi:hypothetical protein